MPLMPHNSERRRSRIRRLTVSNTAVRSTRASAATLPWSSAIKITDNTFASAVSVEWNSDCALGNRPLNLRCSRSRRKMTRCSNFDMTDKYTACRSRHIGPNDHISTLCSRWISHQMCRTTTTSFNTNGATLWSWQPIKSTTSLTSICRLHVELSIDIGCLSFLKYTCMNELQTK